MPITIMTSPIAKEKKFANRSFIVRLSSAIFLAIGLLNPPICLADSTAYRHQDSSGTVSRFPGVQCG